MGGGPKALGGGGGPKVEGGSPNLLEGGGGDSESVGGGGWSRGGPHDPKGPLKVLEGPLKSMGGSPRSWGDPTVLEKGGGGGEGSRVTPPQFWGALGGVVPAPPLPQGCSCFFLTEIRFLRAANIS